MAAAEMGLDRIITRVSLTSPGCAVKHPTVHQQAGQPAQPLQQPQSDSSYRQPCEFCSRKVPGPPIPKLCGQHTAAGPSGLSIQSMTRLLSDIKVVQGQNKLFLIYPTPKAAPTTLTPNSCVDIHPTAGQVAGGSCGAVHLVLCVEDEHDVHRTRQPWVGPAE